MVDSSFKELRNLWIDILSGDDINSIGKQLTLLTLDTAVYRLINDSRKFAPKNRDGVIKLNGLVHAQIDKWFFSSYLVSIRKLVDTNSSSTCGRRGVHALLPLLNDMKNKREHFTRENTFFAEGLPYEYDSIKKKSFERCFETDDFHVTTDYDWQSSHIRHVAFDKLSETTDNQRSPSDIISNNVFNYLLDKTNDITEKLIDYVKKRIAHAATEESRSYVDFDNISLSLDDLWSAHLSLCHIINFISSSLLNYSYRNFMPMNVSGLLKYINHPLVDNNNLSDINALWDEITHELEQASDWSKDSFLNKYIN